MIKKLVATYGNAKLYKVEDLVIMRGSHLVKESEGRLVREHIGYVVDSECGNNTIVTHPKPIELKFVIDGFLDPDVSF